MVSAIMIVSSSGWVFKTDQRALLMLACLSYVQLKYTFRPKPNVRPHIVQSWSSYHHLMVLYLTSAPSLSPNGSPLLSPHLPPLLCIESGRSCFSTSIFCVSKIPAARCTFVWRLMARVFCSGCHATLNRRIGTHCIAHCHAEKKRRKSGWTKFRTRARLVLSGRTKLWSYFVLSCYTLSVPVFSSLKEY